LADERLKAHKEAQAAAAALTREKLETARLKREEAEKLEAEEYARKLKIQQEEEAAEALARAGDREKVRVFTQNIEDVMLNSINLVPENIRGAAHSILTDAINEVYNLI
jgi:transposase